MKPLTFIRGALLVGAITLLHAPFALAAGHGADAGNAGLSSADAFERTRVHLGGTVAKHTASSSGLSGSLVRTIVGLAIVIAVIYGLAWLLRHAKASRNSATGEGLEQVATLPLGTGRSVALVRVGNELHLIGVAEHSVTPIRSFTEDEAVELGLPVSAPGETRRTDVEPISPLFRAVEVLRQMTVR